MECSIQQPFLNEFLLSVQDDEDNGNLSDSDSDVPDELKQDYIDEVTGEGRSNRSFELLISLHNRSTEDAGGGGDFSGIIFFEAQRN